MSTLEEVRAVKRLIESKGLEVSWSGICLWVEGRPNSRQYAALQTCGFRYSKKRQAWYLRADADLGKEL